MPIAHASRNPFSRTKATYRRTQCLPAVLAHLMTVKPMTVISEVLPVEPLSI